MTITYYRQMEQGSDEWRAIRCGLITASEMKLLLTSTLKLAANDKQRSHIWELAAQRISGYVEPSYDGWNIIRGRQDEMDARLAYAAKYAPVEECGFVTNDEWGFTLGYSPDGLVGDDGLIECKSRVQKYQIETITKDEVPDEFMLQLQTGLLVTKRKWIDFNSYCGGLPMATIRVPPAPHIQDAILETAAAAEKLINAQIGEYRKILARPGGRYVPTERRPEPEDMHL